MGGLRKWSLYRQPPTVVVLSFCVLTFYIVSRLLLPDPTRYAVTGAFFELLSLPALLLLACLPGDQYHDAVTPQTKSTSSFAGIVCNVSGVSDRSATSGIVFIDTPFKCTRGVVTFYSMMINGCCAVTLIFPIYPSQAATVASW